MTTPRPRRLPRSVWYARLTGSALATLVSLKILSWSVRAAAPGRSASLQASASPLIQRFIVPDLRVALQGVLGEAGGHNAVSILDCWDGRWASVRARLGGGAAAGSPKVAVDDVVCIDFSGAPDAGDGAAAGGEPIAPAPSVPWLQHRKSLVHIIHAPRGGAPTPSAKLAASITTGRKGGGHSSSSLSSRSPPRTILALASLDGQSMPARYVTFMISLASAGSPPPRLVLVDSGNTFGVDGAPTASKKPRAPGFQVIDASPARHAFYALSINTVQGTFSKVYATQLWGSDGGGSGTGSSLAATASLRTSLTDLIAKYRIKSFLDSSCGSMHWMPLVAKAAHDADPDFRFTGSDAVCSLINTHQATFASDSGWMDFACVDGSHELLPSGRDLILSRDSLQHLPIASAYKFLHNVRQSGAKYLLVGSYLTGGQRVTGGRNQDILAGDVYDIDLLKPPFSIRPAPLGIIKEDNPEKKFMLLLDVARMEWDEDLGLAS